MIISNLVDGLIEVRLAVRRRVKVAVLSPHVVEVGRSDVVEIVRTARETEKAEVARALDGARELALHGGHEDRRGAYVGNVEE